jgi:hypothetical protein
LVFDNVVERITGRDKINRAKLNFLCGLVVVWDEPGEFAVFFKNYVPHLNHAQLPIW